MESVVADSVIAPGRVTLIGTGHVLDLTETITQAIVAIRPAVVGVELDRARLHALVNRKPGETPKPAKGTPILHRFLESFQRRIADSQGTTAGGEMLAAAKAGQSISARIALLDRPADETLRRVLSQVTWRERLRFAGLIAGIPFRAIAARFRGTESIEADLDHYQENPVGALDELKRHFPTAHRVIIDERDDLMGGRIAEIARQGHAVVAVVGDGHVPGLSTRLAEFDLTLYRLDDVRNGRLPKPDPAAASGWSWSVDVAAP